MKKSVLFLTAALSFGVAGAQGAVSTTTAQAPALTDVPAGHWAKDAVDRLVGEGIILGFPDGTFRGTQNLTRYEAAMIIARLLDRVGTGEVKIGDLDDATLTSVRNAINELSAELAALDVRVSDLENSAVSREDFARLEGRVDALAAAPAGGVTAEQLAAVNEMATLLNQDVLELQDRVTVIDGELASFDERLGIVEDQVAENTTDIDAQGIRIADLENGRVKLTLGISGGYGRLDRVAGNRDFDVDRVTEKTFAETQYTAQTGDADTADTRVRGEDTNAYEDGLDAAITVGVKATNIDAGNGVVVEEAGINFGFDPSLLTNSTALGEKVDTSNRYVAYLDSAEVTGRIGEDARFRAVAKAGDLTARPDVVNPVGKLADKPGYNDYLLPSGVNNGVTAGISGTGLPFDPTWYISSGYGNDDNLRGIYVATRAEAKLGDKGDIGVSFIQNNSTVDAALVDANGVRRPNPAAIGTGRTAFGVDARYTQNKPDSTEVLYGVEGVYVASMPDAFMASELARLAGRTADFGTLFEQRQQAAILKGKANFFNLGAEANLRAVTPGFDNGKANMDVNMDDKPGAGYADEVGYGASVSTRLGNAELGLAGDTFTNYYDQEGSNRRLTAGGHIGSNFGAFRAVGFGSYAADERLNNDTANTAANAYRAAAEKSSGFVEAGNTAVRYIVPEAEAGLSTKHPGVKSVPSLDSDRSKTIFAPSKVTDLYRYTTGVGALVTHDGAASNALVPNLDLAAAGLYNYNNSDYYAAGYAAYNAKVNEAITVTPFVGASLYEQNAANRAAAADNSRVQGGLRVATTPLDMAFRPEFKARVGGAYYQTGAIGSNTALTGTQWGGTAEVTLNEFFTPAAKLSLGYGYRQVDGLKDDVNAAKGSSLPADVADFRFGGTYAAPVAIGGQNSSRTQGVFTQLAWNDALKFNYGVFFNDQTVNGAVNNGNVAHGFKVSYGVKF